MKNKTLQIRNSTAEFLIFTKQENRNTIEVRIEDETVWLTQKLMGVLFEVSIATINEYLANIFKTGEVTESATVRKFRIVQTEGTRQVSRKLEKSVCANFAHIVKLSIRAAEDPSVARKRDY